MGPWVWPSLPCHPSLIPTGLGIVPWSDLFREAGKYDLTLGCQHIPARLGSLRGTHGASLSSRLQEDRWRAGQDRDGKWVVFGFS